MNRRNWLQTFTFGLLGGAASCVVPAAGGTSLGAKAKRDKLIQHWADEVVCFYDAMKARVPDFLAVKAMSVPYAVLPMNVYVRAHEESCNVPEPDLGILVDVMRFSGSPSGLEDVMKELWRRWRNSAWYENAKFPAALVKRRRTHLSRKDRILTLRHVIDVDDLDNRTLATLLCSVHNIVDEQNAKYAKALACLPTCADIMKCALTDFEGDGWNSPLGVHTRMGESLNVTTNREAFRSRSSRGSPWPACSTTPRARHELSQLRVIAERRKSPMHWHQLPKA